jgi:hypothetical protein
VKNTPVWAGDSSDAAILSLHLRLRATSGRMSLVMTVLTKISRKGAKTQRKNTLSSLILLAPLRLCGSLCAFAGGHTFKLHHCAAIGGQLETIKFLLKQNVPLEVRRSSKY